MRSQLILSAAALLLIASARPAAADPIGGRESNCETCQGSMYWLEYNTTPLGSDADSTQYEIVLRIDTTAYTGGGSNIDDVAFKVSPNLDGVALLDAPGGAGDWTTLLGGIGAGGCDANASNGFGCTTSNDDSNATLPFAGIYVWRFVADVPTGTLLKLTDEASIKARYVDDEGDKIGALVSERITLQPVPEPGTALLLAFGLAGLVRAGSPRR